MAAAVHNHARQIAKAFGGPGADPAFSAVGKLDVIVRAKGFTAFVRPFAPSLDKSTIEEERKNVEENYKRNRNIKAEKLRDGWFISFEADVDESGVIKYFVASRRTVGGKDIICDNASDTAEQSARVGAFCKSLTPK